MEDKAFAWEAQLRQERKLMRKAVKRAEVAERWASAGEKIDPKLLWIAWHFNQLAEEAKAKNKKHRVLKSSSPIEKRVHSPRRDAVAVAVAVRGPLPFQSVP